MDSGKHNPRRKRAQPEGPAVKSRASRWDTRFLLAGLMLATLVAYQPVWHGGIIWDDDAHITPRALRSAEGLRRIWFDLGATQQYYPVVHSLFWFLHRLWGDATTGYHLLNIVLHGSCGSARGRLWRHC